MSDIQELKAQIQDLKVLFVDDEEEVRTMTSILLKKFFNNVVICENGKEGFETFKKNNDFDIIIADIQMPKMDGITMVKKIKEIKSDIFIIFLTASRGENECEDDLYDLYITKPISYEDTKLIMQKTSELHNK